VNHQILERVRRARALFYYFICSGRAVLDEGKTRLGFYKRDGSMTAANFIFIFYDSAINKMGR